LGLILHAIVERRERRRYNAVMIKERMISVSAGPAIRMLTLCERDNPRIPAAGL
jgi:hypothetical protein